MNLCCPAFADDISLLALHKPSLQAMLDIVHRHSAMWRYDFNHDKSHVLLYGDDHSPNTMLYLGDEVLKVLQVDKHLGIPLVTDPRLGIDIINGYISKGKRSLYASLGLGSRYNPVPPLTLSKLYWSVAIPQMTYGLELMHLDTNTEQALESVHISIAKVIQGLPKQTCGPAVLINIRWWSIHAFLAYERITLLWRILNMHMSDTCKKLVITRIIEVHRFGIMRSPIGPVRLIAESLLEYGLLTDVTNAILHGSYCSLHSWKRTVRKHIHSVERNRWLVQSSMYSKLILFRQCNAENIHVWPWWVHTRYNPKDAKYCKTMVRLMVGEHGLSSNVGRWRRKGQSRPTRLCQLCDMYVEEDVPHILFTCPMVFDTLNLFWTTVSHVAPKLLIMNIRGMPPVERTIFLLSGFQCPYVVEWECVYSVCCRYVHDTYMYRMNNQSIVRQLTG